MKIRLNEDYYHCCCEWCDTENRVLWARVHEGVSCGAYHKTLYLGGTLHAAREVSISSGLC